MVQKEFYTNQKSVVINIGGFNATQQKFLWAVPVRCYITNVRLISDTATTGSSASIDYSFQVANLTASADLLAAAVSTNGNEIPANGVFNITPDQNSLVTNDQVLELQIVKKSTATDLSSAEIIIVVDYLPI